MSVDTTRAQLSTYEEKSIPENSFSRAHRLSLNILEDKPSELGDFTPRNSPLINIHVEEAQSGSGMVEETSVIPTKLPDFYVSNYALHNIYVYTAALGNLFNTMIAEDIIKDPFDIVHSYVGEIRADLERLIRNGEGEMA